MCCAVLITADVVGLYPKISHNLGIQALRKRFNETDIFKVFTEKIVSMAEFVLKNNFFEFNEKFFRQLSETAIGTKFAPP